jgi:hypothetical protein
MKKEAITIYHATAFGISKEEADLVELSQKPWAQYDTSVNVLYRPKRKRNPNGLRVTPNGCEYLVILKGHGHPEPFSPFTQKVEENSVFISKSRFSSFSDAYKIEFDEVIDKLKENNPDLFIVDCRTTKSTWEIINQ